jgi:hypothetical protein
LGWVVAMGFNDWQTAFNWKIGSTLARASTTSGWVRAWETPYRMILRASATAPLAANWSDAWALTQSIAVLPVANPDTWATNDLTYLAYSRGALAYAAKNGAVGASDGVAWATGQIAAQGWKTDYKWRIGPGL